MVVSKKNYDEERALVPARYNQILFKRQSPHLPLPPLPENPKARDISGNSNFLTTVCQARLPHIPCSTKLTLHSDTEKKKPVLVDHGWKLIGEGGTCDQLFPPNRASGICSGCLFQNVSQGNSTKEFVLGRFPHLTPKSQPKDTPIQSILRRVTWLPWLNLTKPSIWVHLWAPSGWMLFASLLLTSDSCGGPYEEKNMVPF